MYVNSKAVACLGVALAAWLLPMPVSAQDPTTTDETLKLRHVITLPDSQVLRSFDISWGSIPGSIPMRWQLPR
jgi:hypothetical protein